MIYRFGKPNGLLKNKHQNSFRLHCNHSHRLTLPMTKLSEIEVLL